jgi:septum formation protein
MSQFAPRIYLASNSPRRRELLHQIHVNFELLLFRGNPREDPDVMEAVLVGEDPDAYVLRTAHEKAAAGLKRIAARRLYPAPLLAADTTIDLDGEVIGKPEDTAEAEEILHRLSGRTHRVLTAVVVATEQRIEQALSVSEVRIRALEEAEIRRYVASGEPMDKAGAYGIQGRAGMFIESINGSYSGIMGLPLYETSMLLRQFGYPI